MYNLFNVTARGGMMRRAALANLLLCATALTLPVAAAQAQTPEDTAQSSVGLDEIIVTARKRAENTQDVPIAISVLNAKGLEESGFDGIEDLSTLVPSLQFGKFGSLVFLNIRGIGAENSTGGSDPGVALHVDGVYVGRPVGALFNAFDSERVEVLRGPQGTLFGRNATGGSINLISTKPQDEVSGKADVTIGNFDRIRTRAAINLPINENISARFVGFTEDRDGFTQNATPGGTNANDADDYGIRGHVNFEVSDNVSLLLSGNYVRVQGVGSQPEQREPFTVFPLGGPPFLQPNLIVDTDGTPFINDLEPFRETQNTAELTDNEFLLLSATLEADLGFATFKSITGYGETSFFNTQDSDETPADLQTLDLAEDASQFSQEFQLLSNGGTDLDWLIGLLYYEDDVDRRSVLRGGRFDNGLNFL